MNEKNPSNEKAQEAIPNEREVLNIIEGIIGSDFEIVKSLEDAQGLYLLEVTAVDEGGDPVHYNYMRAGKYSEGGSLETVIDVVFFDGDTPVGGHLVAKFENGNWVHESN